MTGIPDMQRTAPTQRVQMFMFDTVHVRVLRAEDDEPLFVAADVARALGYRDAANMVRRLDGDDRGTRSVSTPGGDQDMTVITEAGLYTAILASQVDGARRFKRWVTHEVLPEIRRTGRYSQLPAQPATLPSKKELAQWVVEAETRAELAEAKVAELEPPASAWNELADATGDYSVSHAAKVLSRDAAIDTGERRLFKFMQGIDWIYRRDGHWCAKQSQITLGRLVEKVGKRYWHEGREEWVVPTPTVRITPKGLQELHRRLGGGSAQLALAVAE